MTTAAVQNSPLCRGLFDLTDSVVVLTGASSGLGWSFAHCLAEAGAHLVLAARRGDRLEALQDELNGVASSVTTVTTDVSDPDQCKALIAEAVATHGRIDVLVNNAGIGHAIPATRETPTSLAAVMAVNFGGTFWLSTAALPHMKPGSSIINVASVLGVVGPYFPQAVYASSKAAVVALTRDLAGEWTERHGVRVNALCPGFFESEMTAEGSMVQTHSMIQRLGRPEELHGALVFLASHASAYMTGATLVIDGGLSAR